ncbi:glycosyltransferase [Patescibacteria group bacterium]|nr:glycosyltransferase [Patescibacteria group bacterium]
MKIEKIKRILPDNLKRIIKNKYRSLVGSKSLEVILEEEIEKNIIPGKPLLLYVANRYNYGDHTRGLGYVHYNFYNSFLRLGYSFIYFDYDRIAQRFGAKKTSQMLREAIYHYQPEFLFYFHCRDIIDHLVWKEVSNELPTKTIIYLADDFWRYKFTQSVSSLFNLIVTLDKDAHKRRLSQGFSNVFFSQWGINQFMYRDLGLKRIYDVSFIGQAYGDRAKIINRLREAGIKVNTFGQGWPGQKRIGQGDLLKIYNQSKIVFNISSTSHGNFAINARDFEAPACGALLFTHDIVDIYDYFVPNKEIITYRDFNDAIKKIKYYLKNQEEAKLIARAGQKRVLVDHTYEKRFQEIFKRIGKSSLS